MQRGRSSKVLQRLNEAAEAGDTRICMWILKRRFPEDFGRREYRKMNVVSEIRIKTLR